MFQLFGVYCKPFCYPVVWLVCLAGLAKKSAKIFIYMCTHSAGESAFRVLSASIMRPHAASILTALGAVCWSAVVSLAGFPRFVPVGWPAWWLAKVSTLTLARFSFGTLSAFLIWVHKGPYIR